MYRSFKKRILSGLLAGLLAVSNVNITANAADISFEAAYDAEDNITVTEKSTQTYDSGQEQQEAAPAPEDSYTDSEVDFADSADFADGTDSTQNTDEADVTFHDDTEDAEQAGSDDSCFFALEENAEDVGDGEATPTPAGVVTGTFRVSGQIAYDETLDGTDWSALTRPDEFDQPIKVRLTYKDDNGADQSVEYDVQEDLSQNAFYLKFAHDGNGGGDFTIENIPKTINVDGTEHQVTECSVYVEPKLPYYNSDSVNIKITDPTNISTALGTLTLNLKSQTLTLEPTVIPNDGSDNPSFKMNMTFTNPQLTSEADKDRVLNKSATPNKNNSSSIQVPLGLAYKVTQDTASGYRFDGTYTTTVNSADSTVTPTPTPATSTSSGSAEGTIEEGKNVTISTVNYAQNVEVKFDVNWIDNNKATRPTLSESNFVLQYRVTKKDGTPEWKELTSEDYELLGITTAPGFDSSQSAQNQYAYTGLPAVDAEGNPLEYQVVVSKVPDGYVAETKDNTETNRRTFTFEEQTSFQATIAWNDLHESSHRPSETSSETSLETYRKSLKLYRKVEDGKYELVTDGLTEDQLTVGEDSTWSVNIPDIPRYNADNKEYDYVLVQGTIDENGNVSQTQVNEFYKTYYDNGSGSFGNDVALCHNNGKITEVVHKTVDFQANKIWKDPNGSGETRPTSTVTLWRYIKGTAEDIDDAYAKGLAAQVVFQTTGTDGKIKENIVSYKIDNKTDSTIMFTGGESGTVDEMAENYDFPAYDDHGREYVYFVRESLSGTSADEFDIQYTSTTTNEDGTTQTITYKNGAPANGTITNVRRKKEAVAVTKLWQNPAGLSEIDGLSVQVSIKASADGGKTYDELPVYSETDGSYETLTDEAKKNAQTISGFTSSISQGEVTYYVNTYDSEGNPYDMASAQIIETVISKDGKTYEVNSDDGTITINGSTYKVTSKYENTVALGNGMNQYRYTQKNTITATRDYGLTKVWDNNIPDYEIEDITAVNFKLQRRSTKDNADGTTAEFEDVLNADGINVWTVEKQDGRTWSTVLQDLPRYDEDGYEYYYQAMEVSFTKTDGTTLTVEQAQNDNKYKWYGVYYRTPDGTQVTNRKYTSDGGFFTVSKIWQDNGDTANRKDVTFRVYRRDQLKTALEKQKQEKNKSDTDIVDLDDLYLSSGQDSEGGQGSDQSEPLKYYKDTLSSGIANYTKYVYYTELEKTIDGKEKQTHTGDEWKEYILLEYQVGSKDTDGAETAQYTYQQLIAAAENTGAYQFSGTVSNSLRKYNTRVSFQDNSGRLVLLTNTRTGSSEIKAEKTWKDDENASGLRPSSVQFQLYRDGSPYTQIPDSVMVEVENVQAGDSGENDSGNTSDSTPDNQISVSLARDTGIITVTSGADNTASKWAFTISGLEMFSSTAVPYTYNLDELALTYDTTGQTYSYIQKKVSSTVTDTNKTQTYTFAFENTITGTVSHIAYKYWKDSGVVGTAARPDLYMNLYRYLKSEQQEKSKTSVSALDSYQLYTDYKDQIWTAEPVDSKGEYVRGYNWKIMINDLPRFDADGNEYGYVFTEKMNNDGQTVFGKYESSVETKDIPSTEGDSHVNDSDTYEVFTNTISDYMTIQGKKTWTGLSGYQISENELPDPLISLYRTTDSTITSLQGKTDTEIEQLIKDGLITLVDTTHLTGSTEGSNDKTRYAFPDTDVSDEKIKNGLIVRVGTEQTPMLPKFDSDGNRYTYLVRESIVDPIASQLYNQVNANGTLSNVFRSDLNRRKITVTKNWKGREGLADDENKYPSVTYTLYRYEAGKEEIPATKIETHTINSNEFTENGSASYTFDNLLVYSPTGVQYCYYIVEKPIKGYTIQYIDEEGIEKGTLVNQEILTGQTGKLEITEEMLKDLKSNNRIDVISLPEKWNVAGEKPETAVSTCNTYDQAGSMQISGEKQWNDYANSEGLRPSSIEVTLTRHTNDESGQSNKVDSIKVNLKVEDSEDSNKTYPYIVWDKGTDASTSPKWTYTIYNLERYAPNGMPYIYTLSESQATGYKAADSVNSQAGEGNITMAAITNSFDGSYYVRKNWMDGNNKYNLRPTEITVKLQRSTDNGNTWSDVLWKAGDGTYDETTGKWTGLPHVIGTDDDAIVSITLNANYVMKNTRNNSWEYTFTNLPTQDRSGNTYTYRCIETAIGGVPITESTQMDENNTPATKYSAGAYECKYTTQNESRTVIENTLNSTSLVVTKKWEGDQNNLYQTRPGELTFVLQKRGVMVKNPETPTPTPEASETTTPTPETTEPATPASENETSGGDGTSEEEQLSDWADVLDANGKPYTFTISAKENWTKTLEDLPTAEVYIGTDGTQYTIYSLYFRAVEVHADDTTGTNGQKNHNGTKAAGAQNYQDKTDYAENSVDHQYDTAKGCNVSTITNQLILDNPAKSITVTKTWHRAAMDEVTATFELLYKTKDEENWHCYGEQELKKASGTDSDAEIMAGNDWSKHTGTAVNGGKSCKLQTISSTEATSTVTWENLPKYDQDGNELFYKVIEHPVAGYKTEINASNTYQPAEGTTDAAKYDTEYNFTNIELQSYTVQKIWQNTEYAEKTDKDYTATFQLQQKVGTDGTWRVVKNADGTDGSAITLTSKTANDSTQKYTWTNLPKYTVDGTEITYRAIETQINGKEVSNNTNGAYMVSYQYGTAQQSTGEDADNGTEGTTDSLNADSSFGDTLTVTTNRMIYGFVNLSKQAAYLAPGITGSGSGNTGSGDSGSGSTVSGENVKLAGVKFNIYQGTEIFDETKPYVSDVETDANGNLIHTNGKYGTEQKYLVAGTYTLKEVQTLPEYSVWANGVTFIVGSGTRNLSDTFTNTGEHGTAWISTTGIGSTTLELKVEYKQPVGENNTPIADHHFGDDCGPYKEGDAAVNLESRGVLSFTKTGPEGTDGNVDLDTHDDATGEKNAYFGVYLDETCTQQVAGMVPKSVMVSDSTDKTTMVLTDKASDGTTIVAQDGKPATDDNGVPYLRTYNGSSAETGSDYPFTLLSGTYYIKELVAPAGYKLDTVVRKVEIDQIDSTATDDLSNVYPSNKAKISRVTSGGDTSSETATTDYKWSNEPNKVTLYKLDQFGRQVPLKDADSYLELKIEGDGNTFPTGENTIRLYQNADKPAKKSDGSEAEILKKYITYQTKTDNENREKGYWTFTGLLEAGKTYTLSEPVDSVHENYIVAKSISFKMKEDGSIVLVTADGSGTTETDETADTVKKYDPLSAAGTDYENYYKPDASGNIIVMRDTARYLKDVALEKKDSQTTEAIQNISFKLYKYDSKDATDNIVNAKSVLDDEIYLTTDENGKIDLQNLNDNVINQITGRALKHGLDIGKYYFEEVERGASDNYRLAGKIFFEITPKSDDGTAADYSDYAKVTYDTTDNTHISTGTDGKTVIVKNDPVTSNPKTLELTKVDSKNNTIKLAGAEFLLSYRSINHGHDGSATGDATGAAQELTWKCVTDTDGVLYLMKDDGTIETDDNGKGIKPDISRKGSYTLKETKAPDGYMTRTEDGTTNVVTMVTFNVNSDNQITNVNCYSGSGNLVASSITDENGEHLTLKLTVKNEKSKISIAKKNDVVDGKKTSDQKSLDGEELTGATLEIYEGTDTTATGALKATLANGQSEWNWITPTGATEGQNSVISEGILKENTIYTLHESKAPTGYLAADDIYFKLFGTTTAKDGTVVSQLYVWTGTSVPTSVDGDGWKKSTSTSNDPTNLNENVLTMVDETIIAPVDLQKVVADYNNTSWKAVQNVEFTVAAVGENNSGDTILGTAVTNDKGYLVWKSITADGYKSKLIYGAAGQCITSASVLTGSNTTADTDFSSLNCSIILKQNQNGYVFTESYAPDPVHNDGRSYHVSITAENYKEYRSTTGGTKYNTGKYINLVEAEANTTGTYTVDKLSERGNATEYKNPGAVDSSYTRVSEVEGKLAVNLPYQSTVTLHKYDADEEGQKAAIPGTEFTLYRDPVSANNIYKEAYSVTKGTAGSTDTKTKNTTGVFTTDADGNITIEIHEKGTYILKETKAAAGYQLVSDANTFTFTLADNAQNGENNQKIYGYNGTNTLQIDSDGVPNQRIMGEVTLTKKDARTKESLGGVVYTLTRTDVPSTTEYLLKEPVDVVTGHSYKAEKNADGKWQLTDVTNSKDDTTDIAVKAGEIHIYGLNWGTYTLTEKTELSGYKKVTNTHSFTIDGKNNKLSFTFNDINEKNSVTFYKTNMVDAAAGVTVNDIKGLAGAVFEVHEGDVSGTNCTKAEFYKSDTDTMTDAQGKSTKVTTVTAGSDGKVTIYGLPTDTSENAGPKTYHLVEVKAPKGYKLQTTPIVFTIDRQGKVQIKTTDANGNISYKDAPSNIDSTSNPSVTHPMVTMQDEAIKLYIQKYGEDGTTALKGAEFVLTDTCSENSGEANCNHELANGTETIKITADDGKVMIPIERVIGGHTYTLKEIKAPDGYECTAIVTFHVKEDGTIDQLSSSGGYKGSDGNSACASLDNNNTTINIKDEKIAMTLTKVDFSDENTKLPAGVTFTLEPYGTVIGSTEQSSFTTPFSIDGFDNITYDSTSNTYTFKTDNDGKITFPPGLLKHDNSYLLRETKTAQNYYLGKEAQDGVILKVGKNGGITIERLKDYTNKTITGTETSSCPVTVKTDSQGTSDLIAKNMKATSFELTKKVEGNMGDLNGTFKIKMKVLEPDGTEVGERTVNLKMNQKYDSETGFADSGKSDDSAFGIGAIPVGATLVITEDNDLDYTAVVKITSTDGASSTEADAKGTVKVKLNSDTKVSIELTNKKDVTIDVGVNTENQTPWAAVSLIIPALWLAYRYRRKRKGGDA